MESHGIWRTQKSENPASSHLCLSDSWSSWNSPFSSSLWPLNWRSEDVCFTALASIWSNIFTNSNEKKTCVLLCLLCIFKFQTLTCQNFWIFYFTSRLTPYECVVNVCIQRWFLIQNWTIRLCTPQIIHLVCPPKFCISIVINFSWDDCNPQEKLKTKDVQNFGGKRTKCIVGDVKMANWETGVPGWNPLAARRKLTANSHI